MVHIGRTISILLVVSLIPILALSNPPPKGPDALKRFEGFVPLPEPAVVDSDSTFYLLHDDGTPVYYLELPDLYDDHYFNVRFSAVGDSCMLLGATFFFIQVPGDTISTLPDLHVLIWKNLDLDVYPDTVLDSVVIADTTYAEWLYPDTVFVSLETCSLFFNAGESFFVGWEPDSTDSTDGPLAILHDDGIPESDYSIEWWHDQWGTIQEDWGVGVNFFIRALVIAYYDTSTTGMVQWLEPDKLQEFRLLTPSPNPFNPETVLRFELMRPEEVRLQIYDLRGRMLGTVLQGNLPAGLHSVLWKPENLPSGIYLVSLQAGGKMAVQKAVFMK
ncbi:MAG: T9SS type A sorting domain-containing protein [bacterium]